MTDSAAGSRAMWGGRFQQAPDTLFRALNDSLPIDWMLVDCDIQGSIAWAAALEHAGVLSPIERSRLTDALNEIRREAAAIKSPPIDSGAEDVHSWVEARLIERVGDLGKKLHTGRSRNDQVATDLRLWLRGEITRRLADLASLRRAIIDAAERYADAPMPGYTHLQLAQPVLAGHWLLAHEEMLARDATRFADAAARADECPLGCGALAGTAYRIDREALARSLGFSRASRNSLDAVSDRDFVLETMAACEHVALHLSRLAEELIIFSSTEFGFVRMDDGVTSGSSLMPQKKNPDAMELIRGRCGRVIGARVAFLTTLKGLPLAYNKDLQEDKRALCEALDEVSICARISTRAIEGMQLDRARCEQAAGRGYTNATDLADYLVDRGVPFRDAHHAVGRIVSEAIGMGLTLEDMPLDALRRHCKQIDPDVFERLSTRAVIARRDVIGGTAEPRVRHALAAARARLSAEGDAHG